MTKNDTITMPREVVEQALEALDSAKVWKTLNLHKLKAPHVSDAAAALRAALDQQQGEQKPSLWYDAETGATWLPNDVSEFQSTEGLVPLYTSPQPRQPLTDEQIRNLFTQDIAFARLVKVIRMVERAHGIGSGA